MKSFYPSIFLLMFTLLVSGCGLMSEEFRIGTRDLAGAKKYVEDGNLHSENMFDKTILNKLIAYSTFKDTLSLFKYYLEQGADIEHETTYYGDTILIETVRQLFPVKANVKTNPMKIVKLLLDKGAKINATNEKKETALMKAVQSGDIGLVKLLVKRGADIHHKANRGMSVIGFSTDSGNPELIEYFIDKGVAFDQKKSLKYVEYYLSAYKSLPKYYAKYRRSQQFFLDMENPSYKAYRRVKKEDSISSYESFINQYPQAQKIQKAKERLDLLRYKSITVHPTREKYLTFIQMYPNTKSTPLAKQAIKSLDNKKAHVEFEKLKKANSIKEYEAFIQKYPYSDESVVAKDFIIKTKYKKVQKVNTKEAYKKFEDLFPSSEYTHEIKERLTYLKQKDTIDIITGYLRKKDIKGFISYITGDEEVRTVAMSIPRIALLLAGPEDMLVVKVLQYKKQGHSDAILAAKIKSKQMPYKDFSLDEVTTLKKFGISDGILAAMIESTTTYNQKIERQEEQQALIAKQEAIAKGMQASQAKALAQMKREQAAAARAAVKNRQSTGQGIGNRLVDKAIDKGVSKLLDNFF